MFKQGSIDDPETTKPKTIQPTVNKHTSQTNPTPKPSTTNPNAGIYAIICEPEKYAYIGRSTNTPVRLRNHKMLISTRNGFHKSDKMYADFRKHKEIHGIEAFSFNVILQTPGASDKDLMQAENNIMVEFLSKGYKLYNKVLDISSAQNIIHCPINLKDTILALISKANENPEFINSLKALID